MKQWQISNNKSNVTKLTRRDVYLMHHLSHVRKDFAKKLYNSTANKNWYHNIPKMIDCYNQWQPIQKAFLFDEYIELEETNCFKKEIKF